MGDITRAIKLAKGAGDLLLRLRQEAERTGLSGRALKDAGDKASQDYLSAELARLCPDDAVLSEEGLDDLSRLESRRVWIIDPLDGTREYSEFRDDWAVHVALWESGNLSAGAVALPSLGQVLGSEPSPPPAHALADRPIRIAISRTRASDLVMNVARSLGAEVVPMGSAGYKVCAVVRGEVDAYIHSGGQFEWDSAAPVVVAQSRGLHTSRIDGGPLDYNRANPYLPDLLVCRDDVKNSFLEMIREHV